MSHVDAGAFVSRNLVRGIDVADIRGIAAHRDQVDLDQGRRGGRPLAVDISERQC